MNIKVKAIAPYIGLKDLILELAKEHPDLKIDVEVGDLREGLRVAKIAEQQGYDLIISRGGTFSLIKENVSLPVIEIPVSGYDILRVLTLIKDYKGKVGIIGFSNITEGAAAISKLMDLDIARFTVGHESEVEGALNKAIDNGVEVVIGDVITIHVAGKLGLKGILITSGRESVTETLENVYRVNEILKMKEKKLQLMDKLLEDDPRGILIVKEDKQIIYINKKAQFLFPYFRNGERLEESILNPDKNQFESYLLNNSNSPVVVSKKVDKIKDFNVWIYYFIDYQDVKTVFLDLNKHKLRSDKKDLANFGQFINTSKQMKNTLEHAKRYAEKKENVWIIGEKGTGKEMLAEAIHTGSYLKNGPFATISFYLIESKSIDEILFTTKEQGLLELCQGGTLYLEGIEQAPKEIYGKIILELKKWPNIRLILSSQISLSDFLSKNERQASFYHSINPLLLLIPPLRERKEDIEDLIRLFIAEFNSKYGKQLVGIKDDALKKIMNYDWPGNVYELEKTIEEAISLTKEYYLDKKDLSFAVNVNRSAINNKIMDFDGNNSETFINLKNKTLEEIESMIIDMILKEEGMNQSKAAKRLGINRSTLWRKIREKK